MLGAIVHGCESTLHGRLHGKSVGSSREFSKATTVMVTGGYGFIGQHTVRELLNSGYQVVVIDDLSTGVELNFGNRVSFHRIDVAQSKLVAECLRDHGVEAVIHLAGLHSAQAAQAFPEHYYRVNTGLTLRVLEACAEAKIDRMAFASSCQVYAATAQAPQDETSICLPQSVYGRAKLASEWILADCSQTMGIRSCALRLFNVGGSAAHCPPERERLSPAHLIRTLCRVARGEIDKLFLFDCALGTEDGTAVRDYVHVADVARAFRLAVEELIARPPGDFSVFNIGSGIGYSVREIIDIFENVTGVEIPVVARPDLSASLKSPPRLVADLQAATNSLKWRPALTLEDVIRDAWFWELKNGAAGSVSAMDPANALALAGK